MFCNVKIGFAIQQQPELETGFQLFDPLPHLDRQNKTTTKTSKKENCLTKEVK